MKTRLFARFAETATYTIAYGASLADYLNGKAFYVYEQSGTTTKKTQYTYAKGATMQYTNIAGRTIAFIISVALVSTAIGVTYFKTHMTGATEDGKSQITITEPTKTKVIPPVIKWSMEENAIWYPSNPDGAIAAKLVYSDGSIEYMQAGQDSFYPLDIEEKDPGDYTFRAYAEGIQSGYWYDGTPSDEIRITVAEQSDPGLSYSDGVYSWSGDARLYSLYVNNRAVYTGTGTSYATTETGPAYVIAYPYYDETAADETGGAIFYKYKQGGQINTATPLTPTLATISSNGMLMTWTNATEGATYEIYRDGEFLAATEETQYQVRETEPGQHKYKVRAVRDGVYSAFSTEKAKTFRQIAGLVGYIYEDAGEYLLKVTTGSVLSYTLDLEINGVRKNYGTTIASPSVNITELIRPGRNSIEVVMMTRNYTIYLPTDPLVIEYERKIPEWRAIIGGREYGVQYPVSLTQTINETMDAGSVILSIQDTKAIKTPFDAYTPITLVNMTEDGTERLRLPLLVEKDKVSGKQMGGDVWSLHEITVIEETKKLQGIIMPDLSVTQPLSLAGKIGKEAAADSFGLMKGLHHWKCYQTYSSTNEWNFYWAMFATGIFQTVSNIQETIPIGYTATLPDLNCEGIELCLFMEKNTLYFWNSYSKYDIRIYHPTKTVLIRKRQRSDAKWTRDQALAYIKGDRSAFASVQSTAEPFGTLAYKFDDVADYDVYLYVEPMTDERITEGTVIAWPSASQVPLDGEIIKEAGTHPAIGVTTAPNIFGMTQGEDISPTDQSDFLVCYTTTTGSEIEDGDGEITVGKAIERAIGAISPNYVSDGIETPAPYVCKTAHASDLCYESEWAGGKTFYEILSSIGTQFRGIPRLAGGVIGFDIIGETRNGNPLWSEETTLEEESSDMDTQATALVSQAKNMISDDGWETYPSEDGWVTCRSSSETDAYCTRSNSVIKLPRKIYQLRNLNVKNMATGAIYSIFQEHCLESTLWNVLPDDENGKGNCLKYTRGDDKIENIGALVNEDIYELWGLSPDEYVIQNILAHITGGNISDFDPQNLAYRVVYKPYTDQVIRCEQANGAESVQSQLAYNQDVSVATDQKLGEVMQDKVSRLGNNTIARMCRTTIDQRPEIGQMIEKGGVPYYLTKVNYTFERDYVESTMEFSKDKNNIDVSVGLPSEYRQHEIAADHFVSRQISCDIYAVADIDKRGDAIRETETAEAIAACLSGTPKSRPADFYIRAMEDNPSGHGMRSVRYTDAEGETHACKGFALHADYRQIGTSCVFHASAADNYSMGVCAYELEELSQSGKHGSGRYIQRDCRYVDDFGRLKYAGICLGHIKNRSILDIGHDVARTLPFAIHTTTPSGYFDSILANRVVRVDKDNREALSFQVAIHFVSGSSKVEVRPAFARSLYKRDGAAFEILCYEVSGNVGETLTPDQMTKPVDFIVDRDGSEVYVKAEAENWALCVNDGRVRPMMIAKGSASVVITATGER